MKSRLFVLLSLLAVLLFSCQREIDFVYLDQEPMLNLVASFTTGDTVYYAYTAFSAGENLRRPPDGCIIRCSDAEGVLAETDSVWTEIDTYLQVHRLRMKAEPDRKYTLEASVGNYRAVVSAFAPPLYEGKAELGDTAYVKDMAGFRQFGKVNLVLDDIPGERTYYMVDEQIDGIIRYWKNGKQIDCFRQNATGKIVKCPSSLESGASPYSPEIEQTLGIATYANSDGRLFFSDYTFQDGTFLLQGTFSERPLVISTYRRFTRPDTYDSVTVEAIFRIGMATARNFEYQTLLSAARNSIQSFVNEPVILPNWVEGGSGYFEIVSMKEIYVSLGF